MPEAIDCVLPVVYGENKRAYQCRDSEVMLAGPADTGKTIALLTKLHWLAAAYRNASLVIARKQLADTYSTVLQTYQKTILGPDNPLQVQVYGASKPEWFDYPTGSRIWVAGLDKPGKVLSAEHDIIYVNQAEEISLIDWETLTTRTTGRAGHIPYNQTIGDCNPAHPSHWLLGRRDSGALTFFESTHRDNPDLYDQQTGEITVEGQRRIGALDQLTGARKLRLRHGLWAAPEGAIYDVFDDTLGRHVVASFPIPSHWPRSVGIDPAGAHRAAVWLAWDTDNQVLNVYRELVIPFGATVAAFVDRIKKATAGEPVYAWVCGAKSERDWRTEFEGSGLPVLPPPITDVWIGIDKVNELLHGFRLVVHDCCPGLISQLGGYSRKQDKRTGHFTDQIEDKSIYDLLDALRYVIVWLTNPVEQTRVMHDPVRIGAW